MDVRWHFLGWDQPFSIRFPGCLKALAERGVDLDECLVWIPSSRAGRNVINALFSGDEATVEAFHPPRLVTPAQFLKGLKSAITGAASDSQCLYAWKTVLFTFPPDALAPVFPAIPADNKPAWAFSVARQLMSLRARLAEDGYDFRSVAQANPAHDRERWRVLGELEAHYLEILSASGLKDPDEALPGEMETVLKHLPYKRLLVAGILNLSRRQMQVVEKLLEAGLEVDFHVPAPESQKDYFDALGRPLSGHWDLAPIPARLLDGRIQRTPEPRELVDRVLGLGGAYKADIDALVVGSCESELSRFLIERSRLAGTPFYAPEGNPLSSTDWGRLIVMLDAWQRTRTLPALFDLLGHSLFRKWCLARQVPVDHIQRAIIGLRKKHLMTDADRLRDASLEPSREVGIVRAFVEQMDAEGFNFPAKAADFPSGLWEVLARLANAVELSRDSRRILEKLEQVLQDLKAAFREIQPSAADYWEILKYLLESTHYYPERETAERPVSGWLELPWEDAGHLVILGLPDSQVPGPKSLDSFLTPALCRELGLYGPDELTAFHAFRLRLILESRHKWGRVDILLPDRGLDDTPVLPSRFLFLADEEEILERVDLLLKERGTEETAMAAEFGTRLQLPEAPPLEKISVTAFRTYLESPFHFYLQHQLHWRAPEPIPREMDAMVFGSLAHRVLESLNASDEGRSLARLSGIEEFLSAALEEAAAAVFGSRIPVAVRIQLGSLAERLRVAAGIIARERQAGWIPEKTEWRFHEDLNVRIGGVALRGTIDLLERNEETGSYRIVDYKTSDKAVPPATAHLVRLNARSREPILSESDFVDGKGTFRWRDLQLPLYRNAVEQFTGRSAVCAYFCLCKAVGEIDLLEWNPSPGQQEAALTCAEAVISGIREQRFPVAKTRYEDPWLKWFGGDYGTAIDAAWLKEHGGVSP